jgi:hypothetical protein
MATEGMQIFLDSNITRLQQNFVEWVNKLGDMRPAFKLFIPEFRESREGWISAGRTVDGLRFVPLSPLYADAKMKKYGRRPILVASGRLLKAIVGGPGWTQAIGMKSLELGLTLDYASYLQDGTRKMPQRNFWITTKGTLTKMDYAQLLQAMEGQIDVYSKTILNKSLATLAGEK